MGRLRISLIALIVQDLLLIFVEMSCRCWGSWFGTRTDLRPALPEVLGVVFDAVRWVEILLVGVRSRGKLVGRDDLGRNHHPLVESCR